MKNICVVQILIVGLILNSSFDEILCCTSSSHNAGLTERTKRGLNLFESIENKTTLDNNKNSAENLSLDNRESTDSKLNQSLSAITRSKRDPPETSKNLIRHNDMLRNNSPAVTEFTDDKNYESEEMNLTDQTESTSNSSEVMKNFVSSRKTLVDRKKSEFDGSVNVKRKNNVPPKQRNRNNFFFKIPDLLDKQYASNYDSKDYAEDDSDENNSAENTEEDDYADNKNTKRYISSPTRFQIPTNILNSNVYYSHPFDILKAPLDYILKPISRPPNVIPKNKINKVSVETPKKKVDEPSEDCTQYSFKICEHSSVSEIVSPTSKSPYKKVGLKDVSVSSEVPTIPTIYTTIPIDSTPYTTLESENSSSTLLPDSHISKQEEIENSEKSTTTRDIDLTEYPSTLAQFIPLSSTNKNYNEVTLTNEDIIQTTVKSFNEKRDDQTTVEPEITTSLPDDDLNPVPQNNINNALVQNSLKIVINNFVPGKSQDLLANYANKNETELSNTVRERLLPEIKNAPTIKKLIKNSMIKDMIIDKTSEFISEITEQPVTNKTRKSIIDVLQNILNQEMVPSNSVENKDEINSWVTDRIDSLEKSPEGPPTEVFEKIRGIIQQLDLSKEIQPDLLTQNMIVKAVKHSLDKEKGVIGEGTIRRALKLIFDPSSVKNSGKKKRENPEYGPLILDEKQKNDFMEKNPMNYNHPEYGYLNPLDSSIYDEMLNNEHEENSAEVITDNLRPLKSTVKSENRVQIEQAFNKTSPLSTESSLNLGTLITEGLKTPVELGSGENLYDYSEEIPDYSPPLTRPWINSESLVGKGIKFFEQMFNNKNKPRYEPVIPVSFRPTPPQSKVKPGNILGDGLKMFGQMLNKKNDYDNDEELPDYGLAPTQPKTKSESQVYRGQKNKKIYLLIETSDKVKLSDDQSAKYAYSYDSLNSQDSEAVGTLIPINSTIMSDLKNLKLAYVSNGMRLPLAVRPLDDGSLAITLSEAMCRQFASKKCPCCIPSDVEGTIVREKSFSAEIDYSDEMGEDDDGYRHNEEEDFQNLEISKNANYRRTRRESGEKFDPKLKKIHRRKPKIRENKFNGRRKYIPRKNYRYVRYGRGPPYDYQRYAVEDHLVNLRTSAVRNVLYWLKDILSLLPNKK